MKKFLYLIPFVFSGFLVATQQAPKPPAITEQMTFLNTTPEYFFITLQFGNCPTVQQWIYPYDGKNEAKVFWTLPSLCVLTYFKVERQIQYKTSSGAPATSMEIVYDRPNLNIKQSTTFTIVYNSNLPSGVQVNWTVGK